MVADLSDHLIAVTTGFDGAKLLLFGAVEGDAADVIIVVRGPSEEIVVRRKERISGIWINNHKLVFGGVPAFYRLASTKPLEAIASDRILARLGIGVEHIRMINPPGENGNLSSFRDALIRNKARLGLYPEANGEITMLGNRLFRSDIFFPSNVPTGTYDVTVFLFRNGKVISAQTTPLRVSKIGMGARVFAFAHRHSIFYGIAAIAIALFAGWFAGAVAKRA
ncbi:MAG: TIGR02186 family protein [Proteobacteria bacterium]|nr:TIGR02186 family protein [Pseudomonadota bacterium]